MELTKIKKRAKILAVICFLITAVFFVTSIVTVVVLLPVRTETFLGTTDLIYSTLLCLLALVIMSNALLILYSTTKEESPFTIQNARRLKWIGWALIIFEPVHMTLSFLWGQALRAHYTGAEITVNSGSSGLLIVVGLAVLCISMVFRYGVELQKLADETL